MNRYEHLSRHFDEVRRMAGQRTEAVLAQQDRSSRSARSAEDGILIAEGDSWFDFPGAEDVLDVLDDFGFDVRSAAYRGDTLESMVYDDEQIKRTARLFQKIARQNAGRDVKAILLSGGGNDIAGPGLAMLLNHRQSTLDPLTTAQLEAVLEDRIGAALTGLIEKVTVCSEHYFRRKVPVILHGYARPVPDGRGIGPWNLFAGPWLSPSFEVKGWDVRKSRSQLREATRLMAELIDKFNEVVRGVASQSVFGHVHYLDLRPTLSNDLTNDSYREEWNDELHPEDPGFERIGQLYRAKIDEIAR